MGFEDIGSPKSGEIVMVPDFDNYVIKLIISGGGSRLSTEIPILENVENREYYGRTATEIKNVVDIRYDKQQPLIAFVYDNDEMSVPTLDDFINSQTDFLSKMIMCIMWHLSFVSNRFDNMFRIELFRNSFPVTNEKERR